MSVNRIAGKLNQTKLSLSDAARITLARTVFDAVFDSHESFREDNIGADLAYLIGAILSLDPTDYVDWTKDMYEDGPPVLLETLWMCFESSHAVWNFIRLDEETRKDQPGP